MGAYFGENEIAHILGCLYSALANEIQQSINTHARIINKRTHFLQRKKDGGGLCLLESTLQFFNHLLQCSIL